MEYFKYKNYTEYDLTEKLLNTFSNAYDYKECNFNLFLVFLYFAGFLSLVLFLYKMVQWKNWLFTIVIGIIISIFTGLLLVLIGELDSSIEDILFSGVSLFIMLIILFLFFKSIYKDNRKKISGVLLGLSTVILTFFIFILFSFIYETYKEVSGFNAFRNSSGYTFAEKNFPFYSILRDLKDYLFIFNVIFVIVMMYPISICIKKWKSLAEG